MAKKTQPQEVYCHIHKLTVLICPACQGAEGGKSTAKKYGTKQLAEWGRAGGRPKKKKKQ